MADPSTLPLIVAQASEPAAPAAEVPAASEAPAAADAHAAEAADTHATTEHASSAGMPQLDPATFEPQLVWLAITFVLLLVLMWGVALPRIRAIMAAREQKVGSDLDRAEQVKKEADAVIAAYDRAIATARAKGQEAMREATLDAAAVVQAREAMFARTLKERLDQSQRSIEAAKAAALGELKSVATEVAAATTARLGGLELPRERVAAAVDQALARRPTPAPEGRA
jgi:F-type H+-transporting ATPase subunit b